VENVRQNELVRLIANSTVLHKLQLCYRRISALCSEVIDSELAISKE